MIMIAPVESTSSKHHLRCPKHDCECAQHNAEHLCDCGSCQCELIDAVQSDSAAACLTQCDDAVNRERERIGKAAAGLDVYTATGWLFDRDTVQGECTLVSTPHTRLPSHPGRVLLLRSASLQEG
jgi:hypothetical protein